MARANKPEIAAITEIKISLITLEKTTPMIPMIDINAPIMDNNPLLIYIHHISKIKTSIIKFLKNSNF